MTGKKKTLSRITAALAIFLVFCTVAAHIIENSLLPQVTVTHATSGTLDSSIEVKGTAVLEGTNLQIQLLLPQEMIEPFAIGDRAVIQYRDLDSRDTAELTVTSELTERRFVEAEDMWECIVPADGAAVQPGQTVSVRLHSASPYYETILPRAAVQYDPSTGRYYLYILAERERTFGTETLVRRVDVRILQEIGFYVAIDDLDSTERVVLSTSLPIAAGQKVRVISS